MNGTSIKGAFQNLVGESSELFIGEVTEENPVTVKALNDEKLILSATLRIPGHLSKYKASCNISGGSVNASVTGGDHSHRITSLTMSNATIEIDNSLKKGDRVYIVSLSKGKIYLVWDKVVI